MEASRTLAAGALCAIAALAAGSLLAGAPTPLPSVALGATWLMHIERVVVGAIGLAALMTLVVRMSRGELPLKLGASSLEFEPTMEPDLAEDEFLGADVESLKWRLDQSGPKD